MNFKKSRLNLLEDCSFNLHFLLDTHMRVKLFLSLVDCSGLPVKMIGATGATHSQRISPPGAPLREVHVFL